MLPDLLVTDLLVVFCGTAASKVSAIRGQYYAGPGNKFWDVLHEIGLTDRRLKPEEYRQLLSFGIGLTDVVKGQSGNDSEIDFERSDPASIRGKIRTYAPQILAFNGKKAAQVFLGQTQVSYGIQAVRIGVTRLFVAPSTSGAANRFWSVRDWHELARWVKARDV